MVLYVKEILSQHIVLRQELMTAVYGISKPASSILGRVLRISVVGRSRRGFLRRIWADPAGTPDFSWGYEVMYASQR